jgi:hypothetical protein
MVIAAFVCSSARFPRVAVDLLVSVVLVLLRGMDCSSVRRIVRPGAGAEISGRRIRSQEVVECSVGVEIRPCSLGATITRW